MENIESGYINASANVAADIHAAMTDSLHDFRLVYESVKGIGRVFLAKKNGKIFVVKTLRAEYAADPVALAALRKEYDSAFVIDSPYIARTYDFLDVPGLGMSILQEYCPGQNLATIIESGVKLSERDVKIVVCAILKAVSDIHAHGTVHRDIKPANIIVELRTASVKLIDFGCADSRSFYILNGAAGTPGFATPGAFRDDYSTSVDDDYYATAMTFKSMLCICNPTTRRKLNKIIRAMLAGENISSDKAEEMLCSRRKALPLGIAIFSVIAALIVILLLIIIPGNKDVAITNEEKNRSSQSSEIAKKMEEQPIAAHGYVKTEQPSERTVSTSTVESSVSKSEPVKTTDTENTAGETTSVSKSPEPDDKIDRYTLTQTDNFMTEMIVNYNKENVSDSERAGYARAYYDFDALWADVKPRILKRYPEADTERAYSISLNRFNYRIKRNFNPYPFLTMPVAPTGKR